MKAEAKSLNEILIRDDPKTFKVPFFQRKYIWNEDNWKELFASFEEGNCEKYLGSLIIKLITPNSKNRLKKNIGQIIDGQQRLTTISLLTKALFDSIKSPKRMNDVKVNNIYQTIFYTEATGSTTTNKNNINPNDLELKINHSRLDKETYTNIMEYKVKHNNDPLHDINEKEKLIKKKKIVKKKKNKNNEISNILMCYKYFIDRLKNKSDEYIISMIDRMYVYNKTDESTKRFVLMTLYDDEKREQEIFDTINRAGQTLTCADIIKNDLFMALIEKHKMGEKEVEKICDEYWENTFYDNEEERNYWDDKERLVNVGERTHIEILLLFIAIIELHPKTKKNATEEDYKCFVSECLNNLSSVYKNMIYASNKNALIDYIKRIKAYSRIFYKLYRNNDSINSIRHTDVLLRTIISMKQCNLKLIFPCILHIIYNEIKGKTDKIDIINVKLSEKSKVALSSINKYILTNKVCDIKASSNILSKDICIINDIDYIKQYYNELDIKEQIVNSLSYIPKSKNEVAKILLFNLELSLVKDEDDFTEFSYNNISLEHIMPIKWEEHWKKDIKKMKLKDPEDYIYKIGNMMLLKDKMNSKIQNSSFKEKMEGKMVHKKIIPGYKDTVKYKTSIGIVKEYHKKKYMWDQKHINRRTDDLTKQIIRMLTN